MSVELKDLIKLNEVMEQMEEQMLATLELIKETRFNNNLLIEQFSSDTNVVCCDFHHHKLIKN